MIKRGLIVGTFVVLLSLLHLVANANEEERQHAEWRNCSK